MIGSISEAIPNNNLLRYLEDDQLIEYYETSISDSSEDLSNDEILEYMQDLCMEAYNANNDDFLNLFFDYDLFGRDIEIENDISYFDDGALELF